MLKKHILINCLSIATLLTTTSLSAQANSMEIDAFEPIPESELMPLIEERNIPDSESQVIPIYVAPPEKNQSTGYCTSELASNIDKIMKRYGGSWGILVQKLDSGEVIYNNNADRQFIPASNMKLLTTAAALQKFTPKTTISANKSLTEWVKVTNLISNNYYADTLLKKIGGGWIAKQTLTQLGINPNGFNFADGSGLSRSNKATPRALVDTLRVMYSNPNRDIFFESLPTAGVSGTLRNRMKQTSVQGIVRAKTGTLKGVRALSGYLDHREYGTFVFSIIGNGSTQSGTALVRAIDEMVISINTTSSCR
jgi:serine-type D-Ala-D-Ala carboxypeptidase/endopeptidase (penicillin-binding protein 4)